MVRADELYAEVSQDPSGKTPSQGLFIGCFIDTSTGIISFTCVECQSTSICDNYTQHGLL